MVDICQNGMMKKQVVNDKRLHENVPNMQIILKTKILETVSAQCDNFETLT